MSEQQGHQLIRSSELKGEALAWAVAAVYQMPAAILEGQVHVETEPGKWVRFDPWDMLRSLVAGHAPAVLVPDEIAPQERSGTMTEITRRGFLGLIGTAIVFAYSPLTPPPFSYARFPDACRIRIWLEAKGCHQLTAPCDMVVKRMGQGCEYRNVEPFELTVLHSGRVTWVCIDVDGRGVRRFRCGAGADEDFITDTDFVISVSELELPATRT